MDTQAPGSSGLLGSLRGFADGVIGSVHDRVELLSIELHEEKHRLIQVLIWISVLVFTGFLALIFASFALVVWLWETARLPVICGLGVFYLAGFIVAMLMFKRYVARMPRPFSATLSELHQDRTCIRPEN